MEVGVTTNGSRQKYSSFASGDENDASLIVMEAVIIEQIHLIIRYFSYDHREPFVVNILS